MMGPDKERAAVIAYMRELAETYADRAIKSKTMRGYNIQKSDAFLMAVRAIEKGKHWKMKDGKPRYV